MSRLLSEKRIISVDTTSVNANLFDVGACVIDSTNESLHVSDGTNWTEIQLGSDTAVTYAALDASGDIDTNLSTAAANTVPSSQAVKSYVDANTSSIGRTGGMVYGGATPIGAADSGDEYGIVTDNCDILPNGPIAAGWIFEVWNYTAATFRISTDDGSNTLADIAAKTGPASAIDILGSQKITFIKARGENYIACYRSSI